MKAVVVLLVGILLSTIAATAAGVASGEDGERVPHRVPHVDSSVLVNAVLDEDVWNEALRLELPYEQRPGDSTPAEVGTEVLLAYGESHVYAAFIAHDPDPSQISAHLSDRDKIWSDDWVLIVLDTFNSERQAYNFACNPLGVQGDTYESPHGEDTSWDAIWDSAGRLTDDGYIVEMAIPFGSLTFQRTEGDQIWGFDVARNYPRNVSYRFGIFQVDRDNNCYACQYPKLIGFSGASPGKNLEFDPTFSAVTTRERRDWPEGDFSELDSSQELGLTAKWGVTPSLTLSGTANPDFSHVEADAWQLDVNKQFALYYDEKRPFFLEGAEIFQDRLHGVYTRTLADPSWGLKLTGKEGDNTLGAFVVRDERTNLLVPGVESSTWTTLDMETTAAAVRYRRDVGQSSAIGVLATDREGDDYSNRVAGVDAYFYLLNSERVDVQLLGSQTSYPDSTAADHDQPTGKFEGLAVDAAYMHSSENVGWHLHYRGVDDNFRSDLGFRPRIGERHVCSGTSYTWRGDADHWYTTLRMSADGGQNTRTDGNLLRRWGSLSASYYGPMQSELSVVAETAREIYEGEEYDLTLGYAFAYVRPVSALGINMFVAYGEDIHYDNNRLGKGLTVEPAVVCKFGKHLHGFLSHSYENMDVDGERLYTANVSYAKAIYQFNRRAFLRAVVQYADYEYETEMYGFEIDPRERYLSSQVLFSYKINPQTVLFLGYSDSGYGDQDVDPSRDQYTLFAKIGYAFVL